MTQQPNERLLPCPWCKVEWIKVRSENAACFSAECQECAAKGPEAGTYNKAIAAWNTRVPAVQDEGMVAEFLEELDGWEQAYPLSAFPEPDLAKAAELLKAGGMTLDAISASNMRHVVSKIAPKARAAIQAMSLYAETTSSESSS